MSEERNENIIWIDLETTGFDFATGLPLEVAVVVTDKDFAEKGHFESLISHPLPTIHQKLSKEAADIHRKSGLLQDILKPWMVEPGRTSPLTAGNALPVVDFQIAKLIGDLGAENCPLGGSSAHFDKEWLRQHFPLTFRRLHYRIIDVSSVKEMLRRKGWDLETSKKSLHRALPDVYYSIAIAKFYQEHCFAEPSAEKVVPQPEEIPEAKAYEENRNPTSPALEAPPGSAGAPNLSSSPTKVVEASKVGETKVTILHEDHKKAPAPRGATRIVVEEPRAPDLVPEPSRGQTSVPIPSTPQNEGPLPDVEEES